MRHLPGSIKEANPTRIEFVDGAAAFRYRVAEQNALDAVLTGSLRGDSLKVRCIPGKSQAD